IMNKGTQGLVAALGTDDIVQNCYTPTATPRKQDIWAIAPASDRIGGDYSFYTITNPATGLHLNVLNNSTESGANVIPYNAQNASNEQWYT
ncbi:RICIN domain-containing protein, partial [Bacillus pumilus]